MAASGRGLPAPLAVVNTQSFFGLRAERRGCGRRGVAQGAYAVGDLVEGEALVQHLAHPCGPGHGPFGPAVMSAGPGHADARRLREDTLVAPAAERMPGDAAGRLGDLLGRGEGRVERPGHVGRECTGDGSRGVSSDHW